MASLHLTPEVPLRRDVDLDWALSRTGNGYRVKGMFLTPLVKQLGSAWEALSKQLDHPPRMGRYLPFNDYPQRDMTRLMYHLGKREFPGVSAFEAFRRLSRNDFGVFAASTLGRVVLSTIRDPVTALLKLPEVYVKVAPGEWSFAAEQLASDRVDLRFGPAPGIWGAQLGQVEAIVQYFRADPEIEVRLEGERDDHVRFSIRCVSTRR
ncbi:MAG: DUF2378 family protein [Myxococcales bacterium]|nr:DUF2378 family protein [Myxococcales bacterium]